MKRSVGDVNAEAMPRFPGRPPGAVTKLTIAEVAALHGFPVPTVYGWTRQMWRDGRPVLPVVKFGNRVRVKLSDAEAVPDRLAMRLPRLPAFFCAVTSDAGGADE